MTPSWWWDRGQNEELFRSGEKARETPCQEPQAIHMPIRLPLTAPVLPYSHILRFMRSHGETQCGPTTTGAPHCSSSAHPNCSRC